MKKQKNKGFRIVVIKTHNDKNGGHPHVIMGNIDDKHVSVGLTTKSKKGKRGSPNYKMERSPFPDSKNSYMRRQGTVAPKKEYSGERQGVFSEKDYEQAKIYGKRAEEKYLNKKK